MAEEDPIAMQHATDPNVICDTCGQAMQLADSLHGGISRRYVCYCGGVVKHKNLHPHGEFKSIGRIG